MSIDTTLPKELTSTLPALRHKLTTGIDRASLGVKNLLRERGQKKLSEVSVAQSDGGMRGVKCMVTETSSVDPYEGGRFRDNTIPQLRELLPKASVGGADLLPEGASHLLLTGEVPDAEDPREISRTFRIREALPDFVKHGTGRMPVDTHLITQLSIGIMGLQHDSASGAKT